MTDDEFARRLPGLMQQLAGDDDRYIDEVLSLTSRISQRPVWTFVGTWLPGVGIGDEVWPRARFHSFAFTRSSFAWLVVVLLLAIALLSAITVAGALLRRSAPPGGSEGWVAFAVQVGGERVGGPSDIYLVKSGVAERRIIGADGDGIRRTCPAFSPDGAKLAYSETELSDVNASSAVGIVTLGADGLPVGPGLRLPVPTSSDGDVCPKWAPDGQSVAFLAYQENPQLWIARLDGTETQVLASERIILDGFSGQFDWSPDGMAIVVISYDSTSLWIVPVSAGQPRLLPHVGPLTSDRSSGQEQPKWSPDGTRIAVASTEYVNSSDGLTPAGSFVEVYRVDGTGSGIQLAGGSNLAWSPDGTRLSYVDDGGEIVSVAPAANDTRVIASERSGIGGFVWSPDGTRLAYADLANAALENGGSPGSLVSMSVVGDPAPVVLTQQGYDLEHTASSDLSWQPVFP